MIGIQICVCGHDVRKHGETGCVPAKKECPCDSARVVAVVGRAAGGRYPSGRLAVQLTKRDEHGLMAEGEEHQLQRSLKKFWLYGCKVQMVDEVLGLDGPGGRYGPNRGIGCHLHGQPGYGDVVGCDLGAGLKFGPGGQELLGTVDETGRDVLVCQAHKAVLAERVAAAREAAVRAYEEETDESYRAMLAFQERTEAETAAFKARQELREALGGGLAPK